MTDTGYGVYVRIQNTDGALFSSSREEWAETRTDLVTAFGEEFAEALTASLKRVLVKGAPQNVVKLPVEAPAAVEAQVDEAAALVLAEEMLATGTDEQPQTQFEKCDICGGIKDQWKPGGISKNGKKYPGFFGCSNFRNHPRN